MRRNLADDAKAIWNAGVQSVLGDQLLRHTIVIDGSLMLINDLIVDRSEFDRILVVGGGKAASAMADGLEQAIGQWAPLEGWINVPDGTERPLKSVEVYPARPAGVNEPTQRAVAGTEQILRRVREAGPRDLCIVLLSGGGSALLVAPKPGVSLADKLAVTRLMSAGGAPIDELNTVRRRLSEIKGGGLIRGFRGCRMITLILSDVLGDPLDLIASGPTVNERLPLADAGEILSRYDPERRLPESIYRALETPPRSDAIERSIDRDQAGRDAWIVLGNNAAAVDAAGVMAERLGYSHAMTTALQSEGAAESVGEHLAKMAIEMLANDRAPGGSSPDCLITGGEPTVTLAPVEIRGRGGRNQQLVLAAMVALERNPRWCEALWDTMVMLSGGTDGEDGPTDAAGAILTGAVWRARRDQKLDPIDFLRRNDADNFFALTGGRLTTGPTGTNVCDVRVLVVSPTGKG